MKFKQKFIQDRTYTKVTSLILITIVFTTFFFPNLFSMPPAYEENDVITKDVKADKDFYYENIDETEKLRQEAYNSTPTVYLYNIDYSDFIISKIETFFEDNRKFVTSQNKKLESLQENKKTAFLLSFKNNMWEKKEKLEKELNITINNELYQVFIKSEFSKDIVNFINHILKAILSNGIVDNKEALLQEEGKGIILIDNKGVEKKVVFGLKQFYSMKQAETMVTIIGQPLSKKLNNPNVDLIVSFIQSLLKPNITFDELRTNEAKKNSANKIKPVLYKVKKGEMVVREGSLISKQQIFKLKSLHSYKKQKTIYISSLGFALLIMLSLVIVYFLSFRLEGKNIVKHNKNILLGTSVLVFSILIAKITILVLESFTIVLPSFILTDSIFYAAPIAAGSIIICLFIGFPKALSFSILLSVFSSIIFDGRIELFLYFFLSSIFAAHWIKDCRERQVFIKAGLKLAALNIVIVTAINIYLAKSLNFPNFAFSYVMAFIGGFSAGLIAAGFTPLVELVFGYATDIKLIELANLEQPILRRLMLEAPGTYQHSMLVGTMAEAAALSIGANSLKAKVCSYYHDIGKMSKPLYFIENQINIKNKHDKLAPSMSALILISHIKEGVEIANKEKLGQDIIDVIEQHHGTSLIKYFYEKAKQKDSKVEEKDYKYKGPKPQTREAGIIMLADVVEASVRTISEPTQHKIANHVQNIVNTIFINGQLSECELTLKDLNSIVKSFNSILDGVYHHRIEYPNDNDSDGNINK